jgi:flagellin-like protein
MFKKAVSPLIATVLLVMIVVSIGAAVMVVIQGLSDEQIKNIETQQDILACGTDVKINLFKADSKYRVCINDTATDANRGNITLLMENAGQKDITGFRVVVLGDDGFNTTVYDNDELAKGQLKGFRFQFSGTVGDGNSEISRISIEPRIEGKEIVTCQLPTLQFDEEFIESLKDCNLAEVAWDGNIAASTPTG